MSNKKETPDVQVVLSTSKAEELFHNALCNGLGEFCQYGFEIDYKDADYKKAKESFCKKNPDSSPCFEDVFMEIMRIGGKLTFKDAGNGGDYTTHLTIKDVHEKVALTPFNYLNDMLNQQDDAITADVIIQCVLFGEIVFG